MQHGAYAEICGHLEKTIIISESLQIRKYGIIFITVEHKRASNRRIWQGIFKSNCIPVFLWGQEVLAKLANISKDDKIWAVGKLELLDNSVLKEIGYYINPNDLEKSGNTIISVKDKNRIRIISKDLAHTSWLSISGKL